jgi:hypothetical protein
MVTALAMRALADEEVEPEVLHRRVEVLLDDRGQPVDLVDEQRVALAELGQKRRQHALVVDRRAARDVEVDAELVGDHVGQRGLAEARRAGEQEVIERPSVLLGGAHRDLKVVDQLALADVVVERARPQRGMPHLLTGALGDGDLAGGVGRYEGRRRVDMFLACQGVVILSAVILPRHAAQRLA